MKRAVPNVDDLTADDMFLKADETFFLERKKKYKNILYPNLNFHLHSKIIHCAGSTRGAPPLENLPKRCKPMNVVTRLWRMA